MPLLTIGDAFPEYSLTALVPGDLSAVQASRPEDFFTKVDSNTYAGKWRVVFFWPKDFTFICPTEIAEFGRLNGEFADRDAQVLGVSVDNEFVHYAWRKQHEDLKALPFPMLSDLKRDLSAATGVLNGDGVADRATFIVDPDGVVQYVSVTAGSVGRNVEEVLRVLDALQTDELCPCNWRKGAQTLDVVSLLTA
ncbi:MAG TPA: peroxiredoxin [Kineosporiaceae bacterium]|nr:peroxiredoxin [Kineosporiaceae bacterium]